jgi:hypothetical protein
MPKPLSRIQLLCIRLCTPPAPAKAAAPRISAGGRSSTRPKPSAVKPSTVAPGRSAQAWAEITVKTATTRKTIMSPTLTNSTFSRVW